jgi:hypothetical protein
MVTTIQIDEKLKSRLDSLKVHHRETYNELILRLVNGCSPKEADRESLIETIEVLSDPEMMRGIRGALEEGSRGIRGKTLKELEKEFDLNV